jgi:hypothetical protein
MHSPTPSLFHPSTQHPGLGQLPSTFVTNTESTALMPP